MTKPCGHSRPPRHFQAYCVGTSKSGTTSLARMLSKSYRAAHEPGAVALIEKILAAADGTIDLEQLAQYVRDRDEELWLEFESSQLLLYLIDILLDEFPDAKFILPIRDCYSWLESVTNHELFRPINATWRRMADFRFRSDELTHSEEERVLAENGLYTIAGYLSYWAEHNRSVLSKVPCSQLLLIKTGEIQDSIGVIADFLGISPDTIDACASHSNKAERKSDILSNIDRRVIEETVELYCRDLMDQYFPGMRGARVLGRE